MIYEEDKVADQDEKKSGSEMGQYKQNVKQLKELEALEYHRALC